MTTETTLDDLTLKQQVIMAVKNGNETIEDVANTLDYSEPYMGEQLAELVDEQVITRGKKGRRKTHRIAEDANLESVLSSSVIDSPNHEQSTLFDDGEYEMNDDREGQMPVDRSYDWDDWVVDESTVPEYVQFDDELDEITALIDSRHETDWHPHVALSGPTGSAKTTFAYNLAHEIETDDDVPVFTIQCSDGMNMKDVIGGPTYVNDQTWWVDGTGTKALLASRERTVILLIDEVNRATSRAKAELMSLLDGRGEFTLDTRGGEVVRGDTSNLIVLSTMNRGKGYTTNRIDNAERRRLGPEWRVGHLGQESVSDAIDLLADQTPVCHTLAKQLVGCANDLRQKAEDDDDLSFGVTTALVLDWARTAYGMREFDNPVVRAADRILVGPYFSGNSQEEELATQIITRNVDGCPVEEDEVREWAGETVDVTDDDVTGYLECRSCGWFESENVVDANVKLKMMCPECDSDLALTDDA